MHLSRHKSGKVHYKSGTRSFCRNLDERVSIDKFEGIECLGVNSFGIGALPKIYKDYNLKKRNVGMLRK